MRFLFTTLQSIESDFYGRVGAELQRRGDSATHLTFSRRAARVLRSKGFEAHALPPLMEALAPVDPEREAARITERYGLPTFRDVYRTDLVCDGRSEAWCVERTVRHFLAIEALIDRLRPDVVVPEVGNETMRTAAQLVAVGRGIPTLMLGYTIFPRSLMLCADSLDQPLVRREDVRELTSPEREETDAFMREFKAADEPIRAYRWRPITHGRARVLLRHVAIKALWDRDNEYLRPVPWSFGLVAERVRPILARRMFYEARDPTRPFVYFPLHLAEDYKLKRLIPHCANQLWIVEQLARALPHGFDLVVKEHPMGLGHNRLRMLAQLHRMRNVTLVDPYTSSHRLIEEAAAVAVVSSTVGLEALLHGKPVLTLGRPYYAGYGATVDLDSFKDIRRLLPATLDFQPDAELIRRLVHAGMRRCYRGAPVMVDRSQANAEEVASSLYEGARMPDLLRIPDWRTPTGSAQALREPPAVVGLLD